MLSYASPKLFCLLDQVPVSWFWDYCILLSLLFCFLLLLILKDPSFSLHSQLFTCLHPHTQTCIDASETRRWVDRPELTTTSVMLVLWGESASNGSRDALESRPLLTGQLLCKECWWCICIVWSKDLRSSHLAPIHNNLVITGGVADVLKGYSANLVHENHLSVYEWYY